MVERIEREFGICKIHISRIDEALRGLNVPLHEETIRIWMVILLCVWINLFFASLNFRMVLEWLYEDTSTMSIRDILNRLERLNLIDDVESWVYIRELRNTVSHNYPLGTKEVVDSLNELIRQVETIKNIYSRLKEVYQSK